MPLHQIAERLTKRGLVLFISDLYDEDQTEVVEGLEHLRYEGHEVIVFHVLAHQELAFADFEAGRSAEALIRLSIRKMMRKLLQRRKRFRRVI